MGLGKLSSLELGDAREFAPREGWNATVVANMPYGERIGNEVEPLHEAFGACLRTLPGYTTSIITGSSRLAGLLRLSRPTRHRVLNGGIECEVVVATIP
jgi:23S rRNA G2445 N2-methylase RlmL